MPKQGEAVEPDVEVQVEDDAVPIVRIIAAMARRSLRQPAVAKHVARLNGVVAVRSATDPQSVSVRFQGGTIHVERGIAVDTDMTVTADLADPEAKPKLKGAARHPALTMAIAKLLEPPVDDWRVEAERFCTAALASPACPRPIRAVCTDDGSSRQWGGDGDATIEIHGPGPQLASAMAGSSVLAEDVLEGRLRIVGDLKALSVLTRFTVDNLFGEL